MQEVTGGQRESERQLDLDTMLEEALARPGVKEVMKVYHNWQTVSPIHESYLQITTPHEKVTTTDHSNAV